jgi:TctA family transporter
VNSNPFDVYAMALFGAVGYLLIKLDFEPAPLLLGFVLGPMLEENLRRARLVNDGSFAFLWERPVTALQLPISIACMLAPMAVKLAGRKG